MSFLRKNLSDLNEFCKEFQPLFQTIGISSAVVVLLLTLYSTVISRKSLNLLLQQEQNKQIPIWRWNIDDSISTVSLEPHNPDIVIQNADAYFQKELFEGQQNWSLISPNHVLHLKVFKSVAADLFKKKNEYNPDFNTYSERNSIPFGLEVNYIQYGTVRIIKGIFAIQYDVLRVSKEPVIRIRGVVFLRYLEPTESLRRELELISFSVEENE